MNLERLRWGDWIAAIAGLDLILMTFRGWYKVTGTDAYVTAWDALDNGRYLLIATGVVGIVLLLLKAAESELSFPPGWIAAVVGLVCTVYVAYRLASPPSDTLDAASAAYIGLVGALGVTIGGFLSVRQDAAAAPSASSYDDDRSRTTAAEPADSPSSGGAQTWSPAAPAASTTGWSPASPAAPVAPAAAAAAADSGQPPLKSGDRVILTAGGARYPAGTEGEVIEAFAGGALVEVKAADGVGERFEVPDSALERAPAGGGAGWSPAMPAASDDWGFDEPGTAATATSTDDLAEAPTEKKVPWYKREIGGGKKKQAAAAGAVGAAAAGAAIAASGHDEGEKPGFFKRMFGGGGAAAATPAADETPTGEPTSEPTAGPEDVAGESVIAADPEPTATEPDATAPASADPDVPAADAPESEAAEAGPAASEPAAPSEPAAETEPAASEPVGSEPAAEVPAPAPAPDPQPEPAPDPPTAPEPEPVASEPAANGASVPDSAAAAAAGALGGAAGSAGGDADDSPPTRKRSSGSRTVPREAVAAAAAGNAPKVGDQVRLKVDGGKFDAGSRGKVVDVFSAGVIVELSDDQGRTERLDLPFEAIGPADQ